MKVYIAMSLIFFAIGCKPATSVSSRNKSAGIQKVQPMEKAMSSSVSLVRKTGKVTADGLTFNYIEAGSGPPVMLIHGSVSDYREWSKQITALSQHYRVIAYSRRYHWPNLPPGPDADTSLERQVDDLLKIIKATGISPAHIVGHSYGGAVALSLALRYPELVQSLVLAEPAVSGVISKMPENDTALKEAQTIRARMKEVFATGNAELIIKTYAAHVAPGDFESATPEERKMLLENVSAFQLDYNSQRPPFTCGDAQKITVPVLVLSGDQSPMGLQRIAETTALCIKGAKFVKIPQATHWMQLDRAQEFNDEVLAFLAGIKK
jgi:non-heme chloroperoxidase